MSALDKSAYRAGLQCARRLWLQRHRPTLSAPPDADREERRRRGREVGVRARALFPGGVLVAATDFQQALAETRRLLADPRVPALFEAAFEHRDCRVRVDVLERLPAGGFGLREVKAALRVRDDHLDDVAFQLHVLRGSGVPVRSVELVLLDASYERGPVGIDWQRIFLRHEVSEDAAFLAADLPSRLGELRAALAADEPAIEPSPHCREPDRCEFWSYCTREKPPDWIFWLPGVQSPEFWELKNRGVERIAEIPDEVPVTPRQLRARDAHRSGAECIAPELSETLSGSGPPTAYLDFETVSPAIPAFPGMRPYEPIPFQWSLDRIDARGSLSHAEFLGKTGTDPRRDLVASLIAEFEGDALPIVVYSGYEERVLRDLARQLPDLLAPLEAVIARLVDFLPIVRDTIYSVAFRGSFSLKRVVPSLVPGFGYGDLDEISEGGAAARALDRLLFGKPDAQEEGRLRDALRRYCRRDTEALIALHRALRERAGL